MKLNKSVACHIFLFHLNHLSLATNLPFSNHAPTYSTVEDKVIALRKAKLFCLNHKYAVLVLQLSCEGIFDQLKSYDQFWQSVKPQNCCVDVQLAGNIETLFIVFFATNTF